MQVTSLWEAKDLLLVPYNFMFKIHPQNFSRVTHATLSV